MNRLIEPDITVTMFWNVNLACLVATVLASLWVGASNDPGAALVALVWFAFLFFANAAVHLLGTVVHGYSPGAVTALLLYLPFFGMLLQSMRREYQFGWGLLGTLTMVGGSLMFIHGYRIVFQGERLF